MRLLPRRWDYETLVCALRGHVTPAASVRTLGPDDGELGVDVADGRRFARCLRCDVWVLGATVEPTAERLPPAEDLPRPRRGRTLEDAIVLRLIAVIRGLHSFAFALLAIGLVLLESNFVRIQRIGSNLADTMHTAVAHTGQQASRSFLTDSLHDVANLHRDHLTVLLVTAIVYAVMEGVEAVGLWHERRWAEYLTVVATAGFLPFEVSALADKVSVPRVGALALNLVILVWLVWSKRLFGLRGGAAALEPSAARDVADADGRSPGSLNTETT